MATSTREGACFIVPVRDERDAFAVVARRKPRGYIVAVYLFRDPPPGATAGSAYGLPNPASARFRGVFTDAAIRDGTWRALGVHPAFERAKWPFDSVAHLDHGNGVWTRITLDDRDPNREIGAERVSAEVGRELPPYGLISPYEIRSLL